MARWTPGAASRLRSAAIELFAAHGFDETTVSDIAEAAGVTERTFFRHFSDKREVLFDGQGQLAAAISDGVRAAPAEATTLEVIAGALGRAEAFLSEERRPSSRQRQGVIEAHPSLREREQFKSVAMAEAMAGALRERGMPEPAATLSAQCAIGVFQVAFRQWVEPGETRPYAELVNAAIAELRGILVA